MSDSAYKIKVDGEEKPRPIIYQLLPRLFTNYCPDPVPNGTIERNGCGKLNTISTKILKSIKELGATHLWYTGLLEHGTQTDYSRYGIAPDNPHIIKGKAGSPYAIKDYYDIDPDLGEDVERRREEFDRLLARTHRAGLKVIIDFVPNHVAREYHSDAAPQGVNDFGDGDNLDVFFARDNNFYYFPGQPFSPGIDLGEGASRYEEFPAKATGNDCFTPSPGIYDWYETVKLNYGVDYRNGHREFDPVPDTWLKMRGILEHWTMKGVDGFRCDMAFMVPVEFWKWVIPQIHRLNPDIIFIAEIYDTNLYRSFIGEAGFDYLYDKVTLYDTLKDITCFRQPASALTRCWQTVEDIRPNMLHFLENHDEVRVASTEFAGDAFKAFPAWAASCLMTYGPMMIYFGQELGEKGADAEGYSGLDGRTTIFDYWSVPSVRQWLDRGKLDGLTPEMKQIRDFYRRIIEIAETEVCREGRFFDLMYVNYENPGMNPERHFAFFKATEEEVMMVTLNFSDSDTEISVNIPRHAFEVYNLPEGKVKSTELLTGMDGKICFKPTEQYRTYVPAWGVTVNLFRISDISRDK